MNKKIFFVLLFFTLHTFSMAHETAASHHAKVQLLTSCKADISLDYIYKASNIYKARAGQETVFQLTRTHTQYMYAECQSKPFHCYLTTKHYLGAIADYAPVMCRLPHITLPALHFAVWENDATLIQKLMGEGHVVNITDINDRTPLDRAIQIGNIDIAQTLMKNKADVNRVDQRYNLKPLDHVILYEQSIEMARLLMLNSATGRTHEAKAFIYKNKLPEELAPFIPVTALAQLTASFLLEGRSDERDYLRNRQERSLNAHFLYQSN